MEPSWSPPSQIDEFLLERLLGRGASADVWLARDTLLERAVALKLARHEADDEVRARFRMEARAVARLHHPNLPGVHHVGELGTRPYLVTEVLSGKSLDELDLPVEPARVIWIGIDLARGLAAVHRIGVLHRDIKPANAFLCADGTAKLLDFGLAMVPAMVAEAARRGDGAAPAVSALAETQPAFAESGDIVAGTPLYMAPETWRGEPPTRRTDIYSLGALLFELLAGRPPVSATNLVELHAGVLAGKVGDLAAAAPAASPALVALVLRCLHLDANQRPSADELCNALELLGAPKSTPSSGDWRSSPYRGLRAFGAEHRGLFFGRDAEVAAVISELRAHPLVLVVGESGAGKSSLVRAGVVPRAEAGAIDAGAPRRALLVTPGARPIEALAEVAAPALEEDVDQVRRRLAESPGWLARALATKGLRVLLVVDPLEEIWTMASAGERRPFLEALTALVQDGASRAVATLRADFLERLDDLGELQGEALAAPVALGPLTPEGLRRAIVEPARRRGVTIEPALAERLVAEAGRGSLPLLSFALAALWDRRDPGAASLGVDALDAVHGVAGALAAHADEALARLPPAEKKEARRLLLDLVTVERTRARREEGDLLGGAGGAARAALDALVAARLVVASAGELGAAYEVAHEALLRAWPALGGWLDEESAAREAIARARRAAAEWVRLARAPEALLGERQLEELDVLEESALPPETAAFVAASRAAIRRARVRRLGLRIGAPLGFVVLLLGLAGASRWSERRQVRAFIAARLAEADLAERDASGLDAQVDSARADAFARFDARDGVAGEARWRDALALARRESDAYAAASAPLGRALARDPGDALARARAADLAYAWILAAERDRELDVARDLEARLAPLDEDGSRRARLAAPAHLRVTTTPPGARVVLHRVLPDAAGRRVEDEGRAIDLGASQELEPGSYMLAASAPDRYPTRLPVLLAHAQDERVDIPLPPAAAVPAGFVFVPPGTSLIGAPDVEGARRARLEEPEHPVRVDAFLIGEREVTFGEYLAFLASLSPNERDARRSRSTDFQLAFDPDGTPALTIGPKTVRRGEPLCRPKRSTRRCQDWSQLPVAAVSWDDARAYVAWLAGGPVPGARLCSEREWERAARGADGRIMPQGDALRPGDANFDATYAADAEQMGADEVGAYPSDRSPFGVLDQTGNVVEWVDGAPPAGRGGSWESDANNARMTLRIVPSDGRSNVVGFRVCAAAPAP